MVTKTISVDLDAYDVLCRARHAYDEPFSRVIKRGHWEKQGKTCGDLLAALPTMPVASEEVIARLEAAQAADESPDDPWA